MNLIRKDYDREYFENALYRDSSESTRNINRLNTILPQKNTGKLLEIGCGRGEFLKLANKYFNVTGVDVSKYALETTDTSLKHKVRHFDIEGDQPLTGQYDVIVAFNVLEHLANPTKAVKRIFQALQNNGLFVGSVPCNTGLLGSLHTALTNLFDKTHISTYTPGRWRALIRDTGFSQINFFGEIMFGRDNAMYLNGRFWKHLSFNLMFTCGK